MAFKLGRWTGIIAAEALWLAEIGCMQGLAYYGTRFSAKKVAEIATEHAINSNDPETVTENLFDCLEFIE